MKVPAPPSREVALVAGAILLVAFIWSYWPTIGLLVNAWNTEPDYSHGFLVIPIAVWILWARREKFPHATVRPAALGGIALVLLSVLARYLGARVYLDAVDGWSMMIWLQPASSWPWAVGVCCVGVYHPFYYCGS